MGLKYSAYYRLARLDKPTGIWLLLLPCWMGLALSKTQDLYLYALFAIGAVVMRTAGCIINDMVDREFDAKVERTKNRPLASGEISLKAAFVFLFILLSMGLAILVQLPMMSVFVGLASAPLFILYPFMKRFTYWPQLFLGLTFNIGILVAYAAVKSNIGFCAIILYAGAIFWTLGYDTIYAHQDKTDDEQIGVKSTALYLGEKSKLFILVFYSIFLACAINAAYYAHDFSFTSIALFAAAGCHFAWQVYKLDISNPALCMNLFKSNLLPGLLIVGALAL